MAGGLLTPCRLLDCLHDFTSSPVFFSAITKNPGQGIRWHNKAPIFRPGEKLILLGPNEKAPHLIQGVSRSMRPEPYQVKGWKF